MAAVNETSSSVTRLNRVKEVARTLALHPISVYNLIASGDLRATRIGRAVRVSDAEIERFIAAKTAASEGHSDPEKAADSGSALRVPFKHIR